MIYYTNSNLYLKINYLINNIKKTDNLSLNLIKKYPYKWNYWNLSKNLNLTEEFIMKYPYQNWNIRSLNYNNKINNFNVLTKFKKINQHIIYDYSDKLWDWEWLIENTYINVEKYISFNLIKKYPYKWNYWILSKNPNITKEFILKYPYQNWDIGYLIKNNKITDFKSLSKFKNIELNIICEYSNKHWDWEWIIENTNIMLKKYISTNHISHYHELSKNLNLTEEFILKYPYQNWDIKHLIKNNKITDFKSLSRFKNINYIIINNYKNKPWDWEWLIENTDINVEEYIPLNLIKKYLYKWNYYFLSKNPNLTKEFILKYPYKNWDITYLIENNKIIDFNALTKFKNINQSIIDNYPDKPWDWIWLIENTSINIEKCISMDLIKKYLYKWDYQILSKNPNLTENFILKYSYQNWDIIYLSKKFIFKKFFYKLEIY